MDWTACIKKRIAKEAKRDDNKVKSLREISMMKMKSASMLPEDHYYSKITLLYGSLRELLECVALEKGFKIYNHECYTAFLQEILNESDDAKTFDELRKIRNGINYYGIKISIKDAELIISDLLEMIDKYK